MFICVCLLTQATGVGLLDVDDIRSMCFLSFISAFTLVIITVCVAVTCWFHGTSNALMDQTPFA